MLPTLPSERVVLLVFLQLQAWNCAARVLRARQDSDSDSDSDTDSESCKGNVCTICKKKVCTTTTKVRGAARTTAALTTEPSATTVLGLTQTPAPTQAASATRGENRHPNSRSSTLTGLSADPSLSSSRSNSNASSGLSKGGAAGLAIGLLIIAGLIAMCVAQYRRRIRKAKQRPQGFVPAAFLNASTPSRDHPSSNEISEANPSGPPVTAAAVMNRSGSGNARDSSITPLLPAAANGYNDRYSRNLAPPRDEYSSQRNLVRSGSLNRSDDAHSMLTSPYSDNGEGINWASAPLPPLPPDAFAGAATSAAAATSTAGVGSMTRTHNSSPHPGTLHAEMRTFQKALEADNEKQCLPGNSLQDVSSDPPPSYSRG